MSFDYLLIRDVEGERRIEAADLPLRIGTGHDSTLRLPGPGGGPLVLLDILDGQPFVQPVGRDSLISINGEALVASRRLADGDEIQFYGSRIRVSTADDRLVLSVQLEDSAYVTQPPQLDDAAEAAAEKSIAPAAFKRAAEIRAVKEVSSRSPLKMILFGGLAILGVASWLLFTSQSVQFQIDPPDPDNVSITGGWFRLSLADRVLLRQGDYSIRVEKEGYYEAIQAFVVGEQASMTVSVALQKRPGVLTVATIPPAADATVSIDDIHVGPAPLGPVELQPGEHGIRVNSERYLPFSDIVNMAGLGREEILNVQLVPRWADVSITSEPSGAAIFAGEDKVGETPAVVELFEGTHQLSVVRDGFKAWDGAITVEPNVARELPLIVLVESDARLLVKSIPRGANVMVNGRYRGQSPITLDLSPDINYQIGLSKAGYGSTTRQVRLQTAASASITVDLTARTGTVTINVSPADATIYVDGRSQGTGSTSLRLSSAPHRVEVRRDGYESWAKTVTPRPGYPQTITARLRSDEAIARSKINTTVTTADGIVMRRVEPGTFMMGASRGEQGRRANEVLHPVTLTLPFYIGVNEVTNKEFSMFDASHDSGAVVHASLAGDANPVATVTWQKAAAYCNYLSGREGLTPVYEERFGELEAIRPFPNGYRLPTEAEWAWALRYGATASAAKFSWGDQWPPRRDAGNYADRTAAVIMTSIMLGYDDGYVSTAPTGNFPTNVLGLHDGGGNVAEWVNDFYTVPTPGITTPIINPLGPDRGTNYVIRGSSWKHSGVTELRMSYRDYGIEPRNDLGFRIARNAE